MRVTLLLKASALLAAALTAQANAQVSADSPCNTLEAAVEERCQVTREEDLRATFCMNRGVPCGKGLEDYVRPMARAVGGAKKFCTALLHATYHHVDFKYSHEVSASDLGTSSSLVVDSNAALVDVDNDGRPEFIVPVIQRAFNWKACDVPRFVEVDAAHNGLTHGPLDKLLVPSDPCPETFVPFVYENVTYFETRRRYSDGLDLVTEVHVIKGLSRRMVCRFTYDIE